MSSLREGIKILEAYPNDTVITFDSLQDINNELLASQDICIPVEWINTDNVADYTYYQYLLRDNKEQEVGGFFRSNMENAPTFLHEKYENTKSS